MKFLSYLQKMLHLYPDKGDSFEGMKNNGNKPVFEGRLFSEGATPKFPIVNRWQIVNKRDSKKGVSLGLREQKKLRIHSMIWGAHSTTQDGISSSNCHHFATFLMM